VCVFIETHCIYIATFHEALCQLLFNSWLVSCPVKPYCFSAPRPKDFIVRNFSVLYAHKKCQFCKSWLQSSKHTLLIFAGLLVIVVYSSVKMCSLQLIRRASEILLQTAAAVTTLGSVKSRWLPLIQEYSQLFRRTLMLHEDVLQLVCFMYLAVQSPDKIVSLLIFIFNIGWAKNWPFFKAYNSRI